MRLYRVGPTPNEAAEMRAASGVPEWLADATKTSGADKATGRWFTPDKSEAEWYTREHTGSVRYIDVPDVDVEKYRATADKGAARFTSRPSKDYFVPTELANKAMPMDHDQQRKQTQRHWEAMAQLGRQAMAQTRQQQQEQRQEAKPAREQEDRTYGR